MQAVIQKLNAQGQVETSIQRLPSGVVGTQQTLALMHQSIVAALTNELLLAAALAAANIADRAASARAEVERVQRWVQQNIAYVLDPVSIELLQAPAITLQRRRGDCDDQTALLCALLTALGYQCRMVAIGFAPGAYAHVYTEVNLDGQWLAAETIRPWALGREPEGVKASMRMVVNVPSDTMAGLNGWFSAITKTVTNAIKHPINLIKNPLKTLKNDLQLLPAAASGFASGGPWGAIAAAVVADVSRTKAQMDAKALDATARAEFERVANETGAELAQAANQPAKAAEYATRIKQAADPQKAVEEIIAEFQKAGIAPAEKSVSPIPATAVAAVTAPAVAGSVQDFIAQNKTPLLIGAGALLLILVVT